MKRKLILILPLALLVGCTNKVEEEKVAYLEYKNELAVQEEYTSEEDLEFNTYFNLDRVDEETIGYSILIDNPKTNMSNVKALLIHDFATDDVFPSVGIFDDPVVLRKDTDDKITLKGTIKTISDEKDIHFKLYLEYTLEDGNQNKVYYEVNRG